MNFLYPDGTYKHKINPVKNILLSVYEEYKPEFEIDNFEKSDFYKVDEPLRQFHIESDLIKFIFKNHKNNKSLFPSITNANKKNNNSSEVILPPQIEQLLKDIQIIVFYDRKNDKSYKIKDDTNSTKLFTFYKILVSIYPELFLENATKPEITLEYLDKILTTQSCWNPIFLKEEIYNQTNEINITSIFNPDLESSSSEIIITDEIKLIFYIGLMFVQQLDTSITINSAFNLNSENKISILVIEKLVILDTIKDKPYFISAMNLISSIIIGTNIMYNLTIGNIYYAHTLNSFDSLHTKTLIKLLYKPNLKYNYAQDCMKFMIKTLNKINKIYILKQLSLEEDITNENKPFRPNNNIYKSIDELVCSNKTNNNYNICTYNGVLEYYSQQITKPLRNIGISDIIELINDFIGQETFKYMPLCFIISISIWNLKRIFDVKEDININNSYIIDVSYNGSFLKYLDDKIVELKPLILSNLKQYQKICFIVSNDNIDIDKTNPFNTYENKYVDNPLSISEIENMIINTEKYKNIIDPKLEFIPLYAAPNLVKNITQILLSTYFYYTVDVFFCKTYLLFTEKYHNFIDILIFLLRNTFLRIISDIQNKINDPKFKDYKNYLLSIKEIVNKYDIDILMKKLATIQSSQNNIEIREKHDNIRELIKNNYFKTATWLLKDNFIYVYLLLSLIMKNTESIFKIVLLNINLENIILKNLNAQIKMTAEQEQKSSILVRTSTVKSGGYRNNRHILKSKKKKTRKIM